MDPILIVAALVLYLYQEIHTNSIVMVMEIMEILTHGGNNVVFGMVVNANRRVNNDNFKLIKPNYFKKQRFSSSFSLT